MITFTVNTDPGVQTRATDVVPDGKKLRYIMEVYDNTGTLVANSRQIETATDETSSVTFTYTRPQGSTYKAVFWADVSAGTSEEADAYYDTSAGLNSITFKTPNADNFDGEAFSGSTEISSGTSTTASVVLKRAVALVTLSTTTKLDGLQSVKVSYGEASDANAPASSFNAVEGKIGTGNTTVESKNTVDAAQTPSVASPYKFHTFYLFAPTDAKGLINMKVTMCSDVAGATEVQSVPIANVPLRANYKTNISGDFAQAKDEFTISCNTTWETDMNISVWNGVIPVGNVSGSTFNGETGDDADHAYLISSAADLAQFAADVNAGCTYENKYFKLTTNINLNNHPWNPIGWNETNTKPSFKGNFDGTHKTISNLKVHQTDVGTYIWVGFFGVVSTGGNIIGLHVQGDVECTGNEILAGGLAGELYMGTIKDCSFKGNVKGKTIGGLVGIVAGGSSIVASKSSGTVTGVSASSIAGGIAGEPRGAKIVACYNESTLTGTYSAGIAGNCEGLYGEAPNEIAACYTIEGAIVNRSVLDGGNGSITTDCFAVQAVSGDKQKTFANGVWPVSTSGTPWYADESNDGSENKYWKSLGTWNATESLRVYPKLWWEE